MGVVEDADEGLAQVLPVDDAVDESMGEVELRGLKTLGELRLDGFLDDGGASEADEGLGLGQDDVSEGGDAAPEVLARAARELVEPPAVAARVREHAATGPGLAIEVTCEYERHRAKAAVAKTPFYDPERKKA